MPGLLSQQQHFRPFAMKVHKRAPSESINSPRSQLFSEIPHHECDEDSEDKISRAVLPSAAAIAEAGEEGWKQLSDCQT